MSEHDLALLLIVPALLVGSVSGMLLIVLAEQLHEKWQRWQREREERHE